MVVSRSHWDGDYPHPTLNQSAKGSGGVGSSNQEIFSQRGAYLAPQPVAVGALDLECGASKLTHQSVVNGHIVAARMVSFGEYSIDGTASAMKARDYKDATDLVAQPVATFSCAGIGAYTEDTNSATLLKSGQDLGNGCEALVAQPVVVHGTQDPCVSDIAFAQGRNNGGENVLMQPISIQDVRPVEKAQNGKGWNDDGTAYTVDTHATQGVAQPMVLMDQGGSVMNVEHDMVGTLRRETHGHEPAVIQPPSMQVRRLTPVECERLQGFPDNYTNIPWRKKPESPDGPRYKALGNSWAVPNVRWIGKRIQEALNAP